jgi:hypothetical protein
MCPHANSVLARHLTHCARWDVQAERTADECLEQSGPQLVVFSKANSFWKARELKMYGIVDDLDGHRTGLRKDV